MENTRNSRSGKTSPAPCQVLPDVTLRLCWKRSQKPKFQCLVLDSGQTPEWYEAEALISLGACTTPNISEQHSGAGVSFLSQILEEHAPAKYSLSPKACQGILRRAERRGKDLPPMLKTALEQQARGINCGMSAGRDGEIEILNDQGGASLSVEKGGVSPTLRSQTHGNLPITAYAIQGSMIGRADGNGPQGDGINENVSFTLNTSDHHAVCVEEQPPVMAAGFDLQQITSRTNRSSLKPVQPTLCGAGSPHVVTAPLCMATGQANAEIMEEKSPTLVAGHEQPIVTHPQIAGTLCASGAGLSRPAGQGNELDFCVVSAGFKYKASSQSGSIGFQEETAPTLMAGQQSGVMKAYVIGAYHSGGMLSDNPQSGFYEADTSRTLDLNGGNPCCNQGGVAVVEGVDSMEAQAAAVDCRNLRETDEVSGTLLAKAASGGYSLNYQNPVRTGLCVRRLTPTEAERLQGYPDGWTECGADGKPVSDTKRYQMLGNSVAVPCVAYIMQGIRDAVDGV